MVDLGSGVAWRRSVTAKLFALVGVGASATLLASAVSLAGLASVHQSVVALDRHVAKPLGAFADLRDAQGDSRVNVGAYVAATSVLERTAVAKDIADSDKKVADAAGSYLATHGSSTDARARLMKVFLARFEAWKNIRDRVVRPLADHGQQDQAKAAVSHRLSAADDAMAAPLDRLFADEQAAATTTSTRAGNSTAWYGLSSVCSCWLACW